MISVIHMAIHKHMNWCKFCHILNGLCMDILKSKEMDGLETLGLGCLIWVLSLVDYTLSGNYVIFSNLAVIKFVMESWLNSHIHTHKGMICECGLKIWLNAKFMFIVNGCLCASRSIQNFYHVLLCIENSTNYKSLLLTVSFYMLSLR